MRKLHKTLPVFIFLMLFGAISLHSQVKIGNNPQTIDASSLLELESIDKALVITRVSTAQMEAIIPSAGAIVYNTDELCINYYDGTEWINICDAFGALDITSTAIENGLETIVITRLNEDGIEDEEGSIFNIEVSQINGDNIQDGVIDTYHIVDDAIGREQIAANAISTTEIADGTIRPADINAGNANEVLQITSAGNVAWAALNANNITGRNLTSPDNTISITSGAGATIIDAQIDIQTGAVTTVKLAADAVDNTKLADNAVQTENILDDAITSAKILDETITSEDILDGTIATVDILDGVITPSKLADGENEGDILRWNTLTTSWELANENALAITEAQDLESVLGFGADANATTITNLGTPTADTDATTKLYVDNLVTANIADGSETNISTAGINTISGDGTTATPYVITATEAQDLADVLTLDADANAITITNLGTPTADGDAATKLYVDTEIATSNSLNDGLIYVGNTTNEATAVSIIGDASLINDGTLTILDDAITTTKIADDAVTIDKIAPSTTDDQVLSTVAGATTWIDLPADTNTEYTAGDALTLTGTEFSIEDDAVTIDKIDAESNVASFLGTDIFGNPTWISAISLIDNSTINYNTSQQLQVATEGITTTQIADATITNDDISATAAIGVAKIASSGTDGQVLTTVAGATAWADLPTDKDTEYTDGDGLSLTTTEFSVNTDDTTIQVNASDNLEIVPGANDQVLTTDNSGVVTWIDKTTLVPATTVSNTSTANNLSTTVDGVIGTSVSIINTNTLTLNTNNELISTINGIESTALNLEPAITANQQTTSLLEGDGIAITNTITDNDTAYTVNVADDGVTTDKIADNNVTLAKLEDGTAIGQLMQWDGTNWVLIEETEINENLSNTDLTQEAERTYDLNGSDLYFSGTGSIGIGSTIPDAKLDVNGQIKGSTFKTGNGTSSLPSYRFENDNNSGMWLPVTGELALSSSGSEAMRIDATQNVGIATTAPNSTLDVKGSFSTTIRTDNDPTAIILDDDYTVILGNSVLNVELPSATGLTGRIYILKNINGGTLPTNTGYMPSTSATSVSDLLSGITKLQSDGTNWQQIN
jgi:hypothetical protein